MTRKPPFTVLVLMAVALAVSGFAFSWGRGAAQEATPIATPVESAVASPVAGGVPCTALFGIVAGNACVLVLHGSHDLGPVDVYVDGALVLAAAGFGGLGEFLPVAAGERQLDIVPSGLTIDNALISTRATLTDGVAYEVAALGPAAEVELQILPIDTRPLAENTARLRVVHGSGDAPAADLAIVGGVPLVTGLEPGEVSDAIDVPSGIYELEVRVADSTDVVLPLPGTNLFANTTYTFYLIGSRDAGTIGVTLVPVFITPEIAAAATPVA